MNLRAPKLAAATLSSVDRACLVAEASLEQVSLSHVDAGNIHARSLSLQEAVLERVLLTEAHLERLSLTDVEVKACDLSIARCSESSFMRVRIVGGRMTGIDLSRATIKDAVFEECKLDIANFRFAKLTRVQFVNCQLNETDFQAAELHEVEFQGSYLEKTEFGQCRIKDVDVRTSQLYDIRGWQSLKGLTIDSAQLITVAPQLAVELGLKIGDD